MKKGVLVFSLLGVGLILSANIVAAQPSAPQIDLGIANPGILPTSPFYFLKEWRRGISRLFAFNPVAKAELELKIANEKVAELAAVAKKEPQNEKAIEKALTNYEDSRETLAKRLSSLKDDSNNPNLDKLIDKIFEQEVKHIEVFDQVSQIAGDKDKFKGHVTLLKRMESQGASEKHVRPGPGYGGHVTLMKRMASQGASERIAQTIKSAIEQLPSGELKSLRGIEIIDRLSEGLVPEVAGELIKVRQEYSEKLVDEINKISESKGEEVKPKIISTTIKSLPGDPVKHLMILEEVEQNANLRGIEKKDIRRGMVIAKPGVVLSAREALIEEINSQGDIKQKAEEQIKKAEEAIGKLENYLNQFSILPPRDKDKPFRTNQAEVNQNVVQIILEQAKDHLEKAKKAFEGGKYGEAFGLAVSAQSLAENGLRILLVSQVSFPVPPAQQAQQVPSPVQQPKQVPSPVEPPSRQACPTIASACPLENCLKAGKELEAKYPGCNYTASCEKQCRFEECGPMPLYPTREGCERVCKDGKWQDICPQSVTPAPQPVETTRPSMCGKIQCLRYDPVCGTDSKTYACGEADAAACGVKVVYPGECKPTAIKPTPIEEGIFCTQDWNPVCGENGKTYSNECMAKIAGVSVKYRGECQTQVPTTVTPMPAP